MNIATFRTEYAADGERAREMLSVLGLLIVKDYVTPDENPSMRVHVFTIQVRDGVSIADIVKQMEELQETDDRFTDLHRCAQTLQAGTDYNANWFDQPSKEIPIPVDYRLGFKTPYCSDVRAEMYKNGLLLMTPAELTAQAILANLQDRRSVGKELEAVDSDIRDEIADSLTNIITTMYPEGTANHNQTFFDRVMSEVNS